ncbi:UV radiation resistance-associated protein-like [Biomphalaria glabrata]|uniref:UV radiation resistance-associated protein-like n=1 Tax=Biomphalaria glabrata TaxID=6526 RepID=A0A9U8EH15_BIOGL|nr:UV radiation resistance-associated protein-like [Biomphalaria glabrata]KAI8772229.1 UV radiation resistance associated protein [Biomphalaria glabrata]
MQSTDFFCVVKNPFNLQTFQRRLRHLHSIAVRNLYCPKYHDSDFRHLEVFFTLHTDEKSKAFYTSEKITGSLNPTWQNFDLQRCDTDVDKTAKFVVLKIWISYEKVCKIALLAHVYLTGLVFYSNKLQVPGVKYPPNTLLFGMFNNIFIYYDKQASSPQLDQWIPDKEVPLDNLPAVVKVDQSSQKPSFNINSLTRIHTVQRAIRQTRASVRRIHSDIEDKLMSSSENSEKLLSREVLLVKVRQLRKELLWQTQQKQLEQDALDQYRTQQESRCKLLKEKKDQLSKTEKDAEEKRMQHIQSREMLVKENAQVLFRRKQIISEMVHYIYPITEDEKHNFYINGVKLPNAEDYQGQDEVRVSVALGFTCHLTTMVSHFMDMPLRYPMVHKGSRSIIIDHVHSKLTEKDREFPLYGKGKEKFQYNYAVFLLNKNISQLRFYCGLGTTDLRQTLPNLKSLLEQRLGVRLSPSLDQRGLGLQSPQTNSIGESPASRRSQAPSSSASSNMRKDLTLEADTTDGLPRPPVLDVSLYKRENSFMNFDSSAFSSSLDLGYSDQQIDSKVFKPRMDFSDGFHSKSINGFKEPNSDFARNASQVGRTISEEDETEELFQPSDDHFFKVINQPVVEEFNKLLSDRLNHSGELGDSLHPGSSAKANTSSSSLLSGDQVTSFKLIKHPPPQQKLSASPNGSSSPRGDTCESDQELVHSDERQRSVLSVSAATNDNLYTQSLSYDEGDLCEAPDRTVD